jgi:hypothetical protein
LEPLYIKQYWFEVTFPTMRYWQPKCGQQQHHDLPA